ncbi:LiaF transmembrane domain-containing protein [Pedobacter alpinus]|uniref:LiaI-LiaF-like domain-containing protein n=1 Tax=Pedobacter alpinus TaxID=1590643 RepID=A0ABW5TN49_9SPHI
MENIETQNKTSKNGKKVVGAAILIIGLALLAKQLGADLPRWLFSWPMLLIVIGIANGIKHQFKNATWLILILIGSVFLAEKIVPELSVAKFTWPIILIGLGVFFIFGRGFNNGNCKKNKKWRNENSNYQNNPAYNFTETPKNEEPIGQENRYYDMGDEYVDSVSVFGGAKKNILSKNFKGGEVVNIFGGAELNFYHSDIDGLVILEVVQVFGGTKIVIPPTWDVISEMAAVFGGIDDNRSLTQVLPDKSKVLLIRGTSIFGGIEIRNF